MYTREEGGCSHVLHSAGRMWEPLRLLWQWAPCKLCHFVPSWKTVQLRWDLNCSPLACTPYFIYSWIAGVFFGTPVLLQIWAPQILLSWQLITNVVSPLQPPSSRGVAMGKPSKTIIPWVMIMFGHVDFGSSVNCCALKLIKKKKAMTRWYLFRK